MRQSAKCHRAAASSGVLARARIPETDSLSGLGIVKRPDGRRQVTYRGGPLYFFVGDKKRGDVKGEGFKDVGVWHAASPKSASPSASPPSGGYPYPR